MRARPPGCAFHPRCPSAEADAACDATTPELRRVDVDQLVACHRSDEWPGGARLPTIDRAPISPDRGVSEVALAATGLRAGYRIDARRTLAAVDGLDLSIRSGEIVGLVGESGCGKSTLARALAGLHAPLSGEIRSRELRPTEAAWHGRVQIVFQNPASSLNPRRRVIDSVLESYRVTGSDPAGVEDLLARVGLRRDVAMMRPSRLSLGELQRACLARSLAVNPEVLILDEPVSSLDVSIQAQIVDLLIDLQRERGMAYLFISHDLSVVRTLATRVFVMNKVASSSPGRSTRCSKLPSTRTPGRSSMRFPVMRIATCIERGPAATWHRTSSRTAVGTALVVPERPSDARQRHPCWAATTGAWWPVSSPRPTRAVRDS